MLFCANRLFAKVFVWKVKQSWTKIFGEWELNKALSTTIHTLFLTRLPKTQPEKSKLNPVCGGFADLCIQTTCKHVLSSYLAGYSLDFPIGLTDCSRVFPTTSVKLDIYYRIRFMSPNGELVGYVLIIQCSPYVTKIHTLQEMYINYFANVSM